MLAFPLKVSFQPTKIIIFVHFAIIIEAIFQLACSCRMCPWIPVNCVQPLPQPFNLSTFQYQYAVKFPLSSKGFCVTIQPFQRRMPFNAVSTSIAYHSICLTSLGMHSALICSPLVIEFRHNKLFNQRVKRKRISVLVSNLYNFEQHFAFLLPLLYPFLGCRVGAANFEVLWCFFRCIDIDVAGCLQRLARG